MRPAAVLLIDFENFFRSREEQFPGGQYQATEDLEALSAFSRELCSPRRLIVKRAYADFNVWRKTKDGRREYFLQGLVHDLMDNGIEPVQVFRFPGGGAKNAADMRMAMDAGALTFREGGDGVEQFILVTGDSDFIPVCLELRRRGAEVVVIGVRGSTKEVTKKYCDRFEYFEELVAAHETDSGASGQLAPVAEALHAILEERKTLKFAAVKPLLHQRVEGGFDPERFDCDNTGDFLRSRAGELRIIVVKGDADWEVRPAEESGNIRGSDEAPAHTASHYRHVLRVRFPKLFLRPQKEWEYITGKIWELFTKREQPREVILRDLQEEIVESSSESVIENIEAAAQAVLFQLVYARCLQAAGEVGAATFDWSRTVTLSEAIADLPTLRRITQKAIIDLIEERLNAQGDERALDAECLGELLFDAADDPTASVRELLEV